MAKSHVDERTLNLTYVHPRIIVIGSPFLNDTLNQLSNFLQEKYVVKLFNSSNQASIATHQKVNYFIYNFSSEEDYNIEQDLPNVLTYGFPENTPCPMDLLLTVCDSIQSYLNQDPDHVVILHSKLGQKRAGMVAVCSMLLCGYVKTVFEGIQLVYEKKKIPIPTYSKCR